MNGPGRRAAILISGRGSNMAALIRAAKERDFPAEIIGVISSRADARGLAIAAAEAIPTRVLQAKDFADKPAHEAALDAALDEIGADIVCLAGYMRLLSPGFVTKWAGRLINIHPSLLPLFPGLDTHARALEVGVRVHGCSVHFVTDKMDDGPIIAQAAVPVLPGDDEDALAARVLKAEHHLYPLALALLAEGRVRMAGGRAVYDAVPGADPDAALFSPASVRLAAADETDLERLARLTP